MMSTTADVVFAGLRRFLLGGCLACALLDAPLAQSLYRYRDDSGQWVYTDRQPEAQAAADSAVEQYDYTPDSAPPEITIEQRQSGNGVSLVARNTWFSHVQIAFLVDPLLNVMPVGGAALADNAVLSPRSETELIRLQPRVRGELMRLEVTYEHIPGRPGAEHAPERPYRLPFALASSWRVSQAYPSATTHTDLSSLHAIDFVMPTGTGIYAARSGIVIEIADEYYSAGVDPNTDLARANIVRILHDDGTMSLYAHLNWNSIRVRPGQAIERGEYIADSGNTGFSTGPHLHFVVQRNLGGAIESVPVEFAGPGDAPIRLATGDIATAH